MTIERRQSKRDFFDGVAREFDAEGFSAQDREKIAWMAERWRIRRGMTVLEPGCGAGQLTEVLLSLVGPTGYVIALDVSPRMLEAARRRIGNLLCGMAERVAFVESRLEDFDPEPESVDVVIAFRAFPHFDDIPAALRVMARALRPGGRLFIDHPIGRRQVNEFHGRVGGAVAHDVIPEEPELRAMLQDAGFELAQLVDREDFYHVEATKGP